MNTQLQAMVSEFSGKIKDDDDAMESVAVFYSSIGGEIRYRPGEIRFVYKSEAEDGSWVYHTVTITGGKKLFQVFRHLAAGKRESIRVAGDAVTEIRVAESEA